MDPEVMTVRFSVEVAKAVDALRTQEGRTRANMIKRIVELWFREHRPELLGGETGEEK